MLPDIKAATGVSLVMTYSGSLDGAEAIAGGAATDVAWFSSGHYLAAPAGAGNRIVAQQQIMLSPVIIGVKKSVADRFGWTNNPNVTWKDIEAKAADGSFHFAMTNPAASNSGLVALVGVASALSGSSDSIDTGTIDKAALPVVLQGPDADRRQLRLPGRLLRAQPGHGRRDRQLRVRPDEPQRRRAAPRAADPHLSQGRDRHRRLPVHPAQRGQARRLRQGRGVPALARRPEEDHDPDGPPAGRPRRRRSIRASRPRP